MENLSDGLRRLNALQPPAAEAEFLKCCGSKNWARQMSRQLPFRNTHELLETAAETWWGLSRPDWLEAFRSHPKIGERQPATPASAASLAWSGKEQAGILKANAASVESLAELNQRYEEKFGFIYIVCATGKSSDELLTILQERLNNDPKSELTIAAREQARITALRLDKLLAILEQDRQEP